MSPMRNIGGDPNDPSYRYKMPQLVAKVEGRGNGIKTRIVNMCDIAKTLHRDPAYITQFMGCELGAQWKMNEKELLSIVNGKHDTRTLDEVLDKFIDRWVICRKCELPETDLRVKRGIVFAGCNACGTVSKCDMNHRLATYIIKCPPKKKDKQKVGRGAKAKDKAIAKEEKIAKQAGSIKLEDREDADDWVTDTSAEAAKARAKEALGAGAAQLVALDADEQMARDLKEYLRSKDHTSAQKITYVLDLEKKEGFGGTRRTELLFNALFDENILKQLKKAAPILKKFCSSDRLQLLVLGCLEKLVDTHRPLLKKLPDILMGFYDLEVLEEEVLLDWFDIPTAKYVSEEFLQEIHTASKDFISWLKDPEDSEEEEEEEEEDGDSATPSIAATVPVAKDTSAEVPPPIERKKVSIMIASDSDDDEIGLDDL